jgi:DNA-binding XRE family transcriptional regulator
MSMLRNLRERKGLTVSQLAAKASISSRVILDYEDGQSIPLAHAKLLAKALYVSIEELMPPAGSTPPQPVGASSQAPRPAPVQATASQPAPTPRPQMAASAVAPAPPPAQRPAPTAVATPRYDPPRTVRPISGDGQGPRAGSPVPGGAGAGARTNRPSRPAPPPPGPITEGQLEELQRLALKLEITAEQLEERIGKKMAELNRPEAKDWIKRVRGMAEEIAPGRKVPYGQWPEGREDQEAAYLKSQQDAGSYFLFKLFNGEAFSGVISDFTPYTITIKESSDGAETVLRKLAIAYYRHTEAPAEKAASKPSRAKARSQAAEAHQPLDTGIDSDRADEPARPEKDNMDEDRGL